MIDIECIFFITSISHHLTISLKYSNCPSHRLTKIGIADDEIAVTAFRPINVRKKRSRSNDRPGDVDGFSTFFYFNLSLLFISICTLDSIFLVSFISSLVDVDPHPFVSPCLPLPRSAAMSASGSGVPSAASGPSSSLKKAFPHVDLQGNDLPPSPAPSSPHAGRRYNIATELVFTEGSDQYNASSVPIYQVRTARLPGKHVTEVKRGISETLMATIYAECDLQANLRRRGWRV